MGVKKMNIPTIYASNVAVLFSVALAGFSVMWGIVKAIKLFKEHSK